MAGDAASGPDRDDEDIAALAKGGRTNVFGFILRLAARLPFLLVAGRLYGATTLGRFAYAVLIIEFAAQLATLGLKRGLAEQLTRAEQEGARPAAHVVTDAILLATLASLIIAAPLMLFPHAMFPNSGVNGMDMLLPLAIIGVAVTDVALAACAYRFDVAATVRARAIIEPWTISIAAFALYFYSARDGLILSYVASVIAAFFAALWPMFRLYGVPFGWKPHPGGLWHMTRRNLPLAAADVIELGTRRIDVMILGLFTTPYAVGVYYVAQQFASLPQKLKTSFEPVLGPVITRNIAEGNLTAIGRQVCQVGFWIVSAQLLITLVLAIPGETVMGLVGPNFVGGTGALAFLLIAEVLAAPAVVSEAALVYLARHRNLYISIATIIVQALLTIALILGAQRLELPPLWVAAMPALALALALYLGALAKSLLLGRITHMPIRIWRPILFIAALATIIVGMAFTALPRRFEWMEIVFGVPVMILVYGAIVWRKGFTAEDRAILGGRAARA
jgi:O-antigen/teichoic acid export membrane protein